MTNQTKPPLTKKLIVFPQDSFTDAFRCVSKGTVFFRARKHPAAEILSTSEQLGPPPPQSASQNRMSPAGIPMFYGAFDRETAILEVGTLEKDEGVTIGSFECCRDLFLIDLSRMTWSDSIFIEEPVARPEDIRFLRAFRDEVSKPVVRDNRIHIEYVPTQVITEYFRHLFRADDPVDGIIYPTSLTDAGENAVLFCDASMGANEDKKIAAWLRLTACEPVAATVT